ncbi:hypothetical protein L0244_23815 [bacterium]|nr:hypothetical protein [bacterium]
MDVIVSLLEETEVQELGLDQEATFCKSNEMIFISFSIPDYSVPQSAGIGRSSIIAAVVLVSFGLTIYDALKRISEARKRLVPETAEQKSWLEKNFG